MIDTIKIFTKISEDIYNKIKSSSVIKRSFKADTGEIFYDIINDHLQGSFDSSLSVRPETGEKYGFIGEYILIVEGSAHKIVYGHNAYNGFYDLEFVVKYLKSFVENAYDIILPEYKFWYIKRVDIAKCYDFKNNDRVKSYINNLKLIEYPRRQPKHYKDCGIYFSGTTTTLKIYNKLLEFIKNDRLKFKNKNDFDLFDFENHIKGYCRFEVEIKNKKLVKIIEDTYKIKVKNVLCCLINYDFLNKVWVDEFMKVLKVNYSDLKKVSDKVSVLNRLKVKYGSRYGSCLYQFYLSLVVDGCKAVRDITSKSSYYRKINELKSVGVDFSSNYISIVYTNKSDFIDIFDLSEVV